MSLEVKTNNFIVRTAYKKKLEHYHHILIGFATLLRGIWPLGDLLLLLATRDLLLGMLLSLLWRLRHIREVALFHNLLNRGS